MTDTNTTPQTVTPTPAIIPAWQEYEIQPGDGNLFWLSRRRGLDLPELMRLNTRITNPFALLPVGLHIYLS